MCKKRMNHVNKYILQFDSNSFIKMNESFSESFGSFKERNERTDSGKDLFILMNELQESHKRASQYRARQPFELIKLKLCFFSKRAIVSLDKTLIYRLESFKALGTACSLY